MKIGILTFHRCINYGSYWQAKCLAEAVKDLGHKVFILDHRSQKINNAEWRCALQPVLPTPVPGSDFPLYRQKIEKFFEAFELLPLSPAFPLENPQMMDEYDLVIVGSDEVWNLSHPWYGFFPIFFGDNIKAERLISYAASSGNYDSWAGLEINWANRLQRFERISVRDENSRELIRNSLGIEPQIVLDPCLLYPVKPEIRLMRLADSLYAAVYGHNFSQFFIHDICRWARGRKIKLISIGYRNDWADEQWLTAGPFEFSTFMSRCEAVITNFYHGCIFAINNKKPFVCEASYYRSIKILDLLKRTGGEKHLIKEGASADVYDVLLAEPPEEIIYRNISVLRQYSGEWLNQALSHSIVRINERVI